MANIEFFFFLERDNSLDGGNSIFAFYCLFLLRQCSLPSGCRHMPRCSLPACLAAALILIVSINVEHLGCCTAASQELRHSRRQCGHTHAHPPVRSFGISLEPDTACSTVA
jgi:hypothetical protein